MGPYEISLFVLVLIVITLGSGIWIMASLVIVGLFSMFFIADFSLIRMGTISATIISRNSMSWELSAIPLFIWMGELLFRTRLSQSMFEGLTPFVNRIPGRLLHTSVLGSTMFAAVSGSSAATTTTVGRITVGELLARGYDRALTTGSLAGAGTLGLMIPPSIILIIYGVIAEVSIIRLFAAGLLPGLLIAFLYSGYIVVRALMDPAIAPKRDTAYTKHDLFIAVRKLLPIIILMIVILGSIYSGVATPSEAAAIGLAATIIITAILRQFTWAVFYDSLKSAVKVSAMITSLVVCAAVLASAMSYVRLPQSIAEVIVNLSPSEFQLILLLAAFYIFLGLFLDGTSITVMSLPITMPIAMAAGVDPIWFGIFLVVMIELGQVTPPVGFNLYLLQNLTGDSLPKVARATFPFFVLLCLGGAILYIFPQIVLWLPRVIYG
ncbi:TRAP transporter large permease [Roseinatronobacter sp. S2]|uniref:TRAP transporter large permease n=1 Tax=Roseinatronobacter sp. S2 TaxID=3035471 RepID=UPI00241084BE|nr:TRAP transporter large permease subunit [Roseinatronobacter sp. S2]WFE76609.1 TRAP transporter large permease subunit [Roseinatronobacter sp. S2]